MNTMRRLLTTTHVLALRLCGIIRREPFGIDVKPLVVTFQQLKNSFYGMDLTF